MKYSLTDKKKIKYAYIGAVTTLFFAVVLGVLLGSTPISPTAILDVLIRGDISSADAKILLYVRLPRVLAALLCGAALSVSGAVIQAVLANRLASPSIIGVNSGAGLAVTICSAAGIVGISASFFAFVGAFITVMAVTVFTRRHAVSEGTVILVGVAINSLVGAISDAVITFIPTVGIMSHDFRVGDFSAVTYARLLPAAVIVLMALLFLLFLTNELDVIGLGDRTARSVGMSTSRMRVVFLLISAALAGGAVSVCGLMSFVGLLVPHAIRRIAGSTSRYLIPLCALFGGGFVAICDTLARTVTAPYEIPVGIIMAALGAPFFIYILIGRRRGKRDA